MEVPVCTLVTTTFTPTTAAPELSATIPEMLELPACGIACFGASRLRPKTRNAQIEMTRELRADLFMSPPSLQATSAKSSCVRGGRQRNDSYPW